jgi:anti-anti-sigma factor
VLAGEPLPQPARSSRQRSRGSRRRGLPQSRPGPEGLDGDLGDAILRITRIAEPRGLRVEGEIDHSNAGLLARALDEASRAGESVHLDLAGLEFMDMAGLRVLVSTAERLSSGHVLVLHAIRPYLRRVMELVGWDRAPGLRIGDDQ